MMRRRIQLLVALLGVVAVLGLSAQQKTAVKELTIEELFLRSLEFQVLREKAFSTDYDSKMSALDDLDKKISEGAVGDNVAQVEFVLEYLSLEGTGHRSRESGRMVNYFPDVRRRATGMLGRIATVQSKNALISVLLNDDEPMVKAEAAYALGMLGMNDNNEVVKALAFAVDREDHTRPDNNWGYAILLAFEKLGQKTGGIQDSSIAARAIMKISQGNYLKSVKAKAMQVLETLKK